jgi:hypothetical protein
VAPVCGPLLRPTGFHHVGLKIFISCVQRNGNYGSHDRTLDAGQLARKIANKKNLGGQILLSDPAVTSLPRLYQFTFVK